MIKLKKIVSKLTAVQGWVCAFVLETGKLKAEKEQSKRKRKYVPVHATSLVSFVVPGCVLINASRQKNGSGTGIKLCVRSEQQIYLDLIGFRIFPESCLICQVNKSVQCHILIFL